MALSDTIISAESGGDPNAKNSRSSATGAGQFINSTWLSMIKQHRPDLAQGKSDADILAMRSDPALSKQMVDAYAADNGAILQKNGLPVTPGTTYLAHFAGPEGAVSVLQADPNAPVSSILGEKVVAANPFLKDMTAADLQAWANKRIGDDATLQTAAPQAPQQPAQPLSIPQGQAPIFPSQAAPQTTPMTPQGGGAPQMGGFNPDIPQAPPIFYAPRRAPNLTGLQQALGNRGFFFPKG